MVLQYHLPRCDKGGQSQIADSSSLISFRKPEPICSPSSHEIARADRRDLVRAFGGVGPSSLLAPATSAGTNKESSWLTSLTGSGGDKEGGAAGPFTPCSNSVFQREA